MTVDVRNPANGEVCTTFSSTSSKGVEDAVSAAASAFVEWRRTPPAQRSAALLLIARDLADQAGAFAEVESQEAGKPLTAVLCDELPAMVDQLQFFAGAARRLDVPSAGEYVVDHSSSVRREAIGVCAQITPWNYPLMMAVWKLAPAIAAGNCVVIKPSELTPSSTRMLVELAARHLPEGVVNIVLGGADVGRALVSDSRVDLIALTGSTRAGREVASIAATRTARVHLELGGNAPVVVFDDADVDRVVDVAGRAAYYNAGQDCTAPSRFIVAASRHDEFVERLTKMASSLRVGQTDDPSTELGPVASESQRSRVLGLVTGRSAGASVATGGRAIDGPGYFIEPTVIVGVDQSEELVQGEIFGPVITVQRFDDELAALAMANGVEQGLASSVWTADHARALRAARDLNFGAVWINTHGPSPAELPHGGFGSSGYGKDLSAYGLEDYTRIKHVTSWLGR